MVVCLIVAWSLQFVITAGGLRWSERFFYVSTTGPYPVLLALLLMVAYLPTMQWKGLWGVLFPQDWTDHLLRKEVRWKECCAMGE